MKIKDKIQANAVSLSKQHQSLALEFATGCGKSLASIKIVEEIIKTNPKAKGYLICKESAHLKNWLEDISKHKKDHVLDNTKSFLYASSHKYREMVDFIILDECHALTWKRLVMIQHMIHKDTKLIFLSATISEEKKYLVNRVSKPTVKYYTITLIEAIEMGLLPTPKLVVHKVQLNNVARNKTYLFGKKKVTITERKYYENLSQKIDYFNDLASKTTNQKELLGFRNKALSTASKRKKFLAESKTKYAKKIIDSFRSDKSRFIAFTGSIEQSLLLGSKSSINSKNLKKHNQALIDCFNDNQCDELFAVKMLREGMNLTNIEKGLIVQLDSTVGSFYQMLGRAMRSEFPVMHLIVVENTRDEYYFNKSMLDFDQKYVTYV